MKLTIEVEKESEGRWIGAVPELPGCLVYGKTPEDAARRAQALAMRAIADRIEHGEDIFTGKPMAEPARTVRAFEFAAQL